MGYVDALIAFWSGRLLDDCLLGQSGVGAAVRGTDAVDEVTAYGMVRTLSYRFGGAEK